MPRRGGYNRLTLARKQAVALDRQREPAVTCPRCETQTTAADLLGHVDRCPGPRAPHALAKWITWRDALELGVSHSTMSFWVRRRDVQSRIDGGERRYLFRDLSLRLAARRGRRQSNPLDREKRLPVEEKKDPEEGMPNKKPATRDAYAEIQAQVDLALSAAEPIAAAVACRRAHLLLARVATTAEFDSRRSRAIAHALRGAARAEATAR